jgi:D-alanyl-D-alanine carboxypeptidase
VELAIDTHRRLRFLVVSLVTLLIAGCAATPPTEAPSPSTAVALSSIATAPSGGSAAPSTSPASPSLPAPPDTPQPPTTVPPTPVPTATGVLRAADDPGMQAALQAQLDRSVELRHIPGLTAAVTFADGSRWTGAAGEAQLERSVAATPTTRFSIGSITKTFVSALILQLAEEGRLGLDDPLAGYVPDFPNAANITLRQMLSHRSGIYNYFENPAYNARVFSHPTKRWTVDEILSFVKAPYFAPGTGYHYSNTNYVLLGLVAEHVTGTSLASEIRHRFLDPLELMDTDFQGSEPLPRTGAAHGYLYLGGRHQGLWDGSPIVPNTSAVTVAWAAGAMSSTVGDLSRWADALYAGTVLKPDSLAQLFAFDPKSGYGLGARTGTIELQRIIGHTGSLRGFTASMWYFPDIQMTVVVETNLGRINPNAIVDALCRAAFRRLGIPIVPSPTPSPSPSGTPPPSVAP